MQFTIEIVTIGGYLKLVGNRSTITQYTVLMPSDVNASNMHDNTKFCVELCTKYSPIVTAPATTRLNTEILMRERKRERETYIFISFHFLWVI